MDDRTARINDVGYISLTLDLVGHDEWFMETTENFSWVVTIQKHCSDAYFRIGPTPCVRTSQPSSNSMGEPQLPFEHIPMGLSA